MLDAAVAELNKNASEGQRTVTALLATRLGISRLSRAIISAYSSSNLQEVDLDAKEALQLLGELKSQVAQIAGQAMLGTSGSAINAQLERITKAAEKAANLALEAGNVKAAAIASGEGRKAFNESLQAIEEYIKLNDKQMADIATEGTNEAAFAKTTLVAIIIGSLLIALASATWIALNISRGLSRAVGLADAVAIGDLSQKIDVSSNDEIGDLVNSLNKMTANLNGTAAIANEISQGNLMVETKRLSDKDTLGIALERMVEKLREIVAEASTAANNVSAGSQELSASAEQLSQGATEQASSAEEASSSMEEMAANVKQNADNASQTEKIAAPVGQGCASQRRRRRHARSRRCRRSPRRSPSCRKSPGRPICWRSTPRSKRLGPANMARALRWSPPKCASSPNAARRRPPRSAPCPVETVKAAQEAGDMLSKLVPDIKKTAELVAEITAACREQDVGSAQINQAIQQLDKVGQQNASASEQMSSTSEELAVAGRAAAVDDRFFRIDQTEAGAAPVERAVQPAHGEGGKHGGGRSRRQEAAPQSPRARLRRPMAAAVASPSTWTTTRRSRRRFSSLRTSPGLAVRPGSSAMFG